MNNIKNITVIITLIIISIVAITPIKTEHLSIGDVVSAVSSGGNDFKNFVEDAAGGVAGAIKGAVGAIGDAIDVEGIAKRMATDIFNDLIKPALQPLFTLLESIPNDAGVPDLIGIINNIIRMEPYIKNILISIISINLTLQRVLIEINKDAKNIKSVIPVIKKCIKRIEYAHQRLLNILKCVKLLGFMIENRRPLFIIRATKLLMYNIMDTINYMKMSTRTTFIDLHNTNPPLWKVINGPFYKSSIISLLNYNRNMSQNMNIIIRITSDILGNLRSFLNRSLVSKFDSRNLRRTIMTFENMLRQMKIYVINIPNIQLDVDYSIIYKVAKNIVITGTIPPGKSLTYNRDYIQENIKNHPY